MDSGLSTEEKEEAEDEGREEGIGMKYAKESREETFHRTSALIRMKTVI